MAVPFVPPESFIRLNRTTGKYSYGVKLLANPGSRKPYVEQALGFDAESVDEASHRIAQAVERMRREFIAKRRQSLNYDY